MSFLSTCQGSVHYQSLGKGEPVILLHGWLNSWDVWRDSMRALSADHRYRVYAVDFWGFGNSTRQASDETRWSPLSSFVTLVREFMDTLGIARAKILGHSMGGTVALQFAHSHPDRLDKVAAVCTPLSGRLINPVLKLAGAEWLGKAARKHPALVGSVVHPTTGFVLRALLAAERPGVRRMILRDLRRTTLESYFHSISDLRQTDMRRVLSVLRVPVLAVFGAQDNIVSLRNAEITTAHTAATVETLILSNSRHFPMFDEPDRFISALASFFSLPSHSQASVR